MAAEKPVIKTAAAAQKAIDEVLFDVLEDLGFHRNIWNFDPWQVRVLLRGLALVLAVLAVWSWSHMGLQRWTFTIFCGVVLAVHWYWYTKVECGGGAFLFSPDWRDSLVRTRTTATNFVVDITVGYQLELSASLPLTAIYDHLDEDGVDEEWLAEELDQQFNHKWT